MRWGLLGVRLGIAIVSLIITLIVVLSIVPLALGGLTVDFPQKDASGPSYRDGTFYYSVPVDVYNGGYFDINDFSVHLRITDHGVLIAEHTSEPQSIAAGRTTRLDVAFQVPVGQVGEEEMRKLVFNSTTLDVEIGVSAAYSLGLVRAQIHSDQAMDWQPLVSDLRVDTGSSDAQLNGTGLDLVVPYDFKASNFVQGRSIGMHATLMNGTKEMAEAKQDITMAQSNSGQLRFTIGQQDALWLRTHSADLTVVMKVTYEGATLSQEYPYHWEAML